MQQSHSRRSFLRRSAAVTLAAPVVSSLEEYALVAQETGAGPGAAPVPRATVPQGRIGQVAMSRLICGGNLISGYAHSRDLIYVSRLLKAYFTEAKILETWSLCEQQGVNTMIFTPADRQALRLYAQYRAQGGRMQCLAQLTPPKDDAGMKTCIQQAVEAGVVGGVLVGNYGDAWTRDGDTDRIGRFLELLKAQGLIAGVAGHELRTIQTVEKAGLNPDFYMKTLHSNRYWSKRRPEQVQEVIDNYAVDNYWCLDPDATIRFMQELERPWLAYKVLAAGAIHPKAGFQYAFENGADFCVVGMFDFQITENVAVANQVLRATEHRVRDWMA